MLIRSNALSLSLHCAVHLKLENLLPSYSFKYRGISLFAHCARNTHGPDTHLVIASGGNAGLAAACAAQELSLKCTVYVPHGAKRSTIALLEAHGARVVVVGKFYLQALEGAEEFVDSQPNAVMVPAYDDPILWEGHSTMITEIPSQLQAKPDTIFCSVGGGGMLGGIIVGCKKLGWEDVPIITLETIGSDCFYHSIALNRHRSNHSSTHVLPEGVDLIIDEPNDVLLAYFNSFSSRASGSLGASSPAPAVVKMALERKGGIKCVSVPDELSMQALLSFVEDHKLLIELACSTTLTPAYHPSLFSKLVPGQPKHVVFIVCGGFKISLDDLVEYRQLLDVDRGREKYWQVLCDGEVISIDK